MKRDARSTPRLRWSIQFAVVAGVIGLVISDAVPNSNHDIKDIPQPERLRGSRKFKRETNECTEPGFFASPVDCRHFYRCIEVDGNGLDAVMRYSYAHAPMYKKLYYECSPGTIFDPMTSQCNYPQYVNPKPACYQNQDQQHHNQNQEQNQNHHNPNYPPQNPPQHAQSPPVGSQPPCMNDTHSHPPGQPHPESEGHYQPPPNNGGHRPPSGQRPPSSPEGGNQCNSEGFFGNEQDCMKFYRCVSTPSGSYTMYNFDCPPGTVFDEAVSTCNHAWAVSPSSKCYNPVHPGNNEIGGGEGQEGGEEETHHQTPAPGAPSHRPKPTHGPTTHRPTHRPITHRPIHRPTTHRPIHKPTTQRPAQKPTTQRPTQAPQGSGNGHENHNHGEKPCDKDEEVVKPPPGHFNETEPTSEGGPGGTGATAGQDFDEIDQQGEGSHQGGGGQNQQKPAPTNKPQSTPSCAQEGFNPVPNDCNRFYRCVNFDGSFTKFDFQCGPGTMYHPELITCVHPWQMPARSSCRPGGSGDGEGTEEGPEEGIDSVPNASSTPATKPCDKDNATSSTPPTTTKRPTPTTPRPTTPKPTTPKPTTPKPTTPKPTTPKPTTPPPTLAPAKPCDKDKENSTTPIPPTTPTPKPTTTPTTTPKPTPAPTKPCDKDKENSTTPVTTEPPTTTPTTLPPTEATTPSNNQNRPQNCNNPEITCTTAGFFGHPTDCKKFYRCVDLHQTGEHYTIFHFDCGAGTIFDESISVCNHPWAVQPPPPCSRCDGDNNEETQEATTKKPCDQLQTVAPSTEMSTTQGTTEVTTPQNIEVTTQVTTTERPEFDTEPTVLSTTSPTTTMENTTNPPTTTMMPTTTTEATTTTTEPTTTTEATTTTTEPTTTTTEPTTTTTEATTTTTEPTTTTTEPTTTTTEPTTTTTEPTTTTTEPTTTTTEPTTTTTEPTTTTTETTTTTTEPTTTEPTTTTVPTTTTTEPTTTTTEATTTTEPPEIPEFLINCAGGTSARPLRPHPIDCTKYYTCNYVEGAFIIKVEKCPADKVFVQDRQECVDKKLAPECTNETITTTEESEIRRCEHVIENSKRNKPFLINPTPQRISSQMQGYPLPNNFTNNYYINPDNSCPSEGIFGVPGDCLRFYKCVKNRGGVLINLLMKCPTFYKFHNGKCLKESTLQKMGIVCNNEERSRSLEDELYLNTDDGLPVIHFNPELVEGGSDASLFY